MRSLKIIFILIFLLAFKIYATPDNDALEITATFCHFSDSGLRCSCPNEAKENTAEEKKTVQKIRNYYLHSCTKCSGNFGEV